MTDRNRANLSLGQPPDELKKKIGQVPKTWLWVLLLSHVVVVALLVVLLTRFPQRSPHATAAGAPDAEGLRAAAQALEDRSLDAQAAHTWGKYLEAAPDTTQRTEILYRVGTLYMQAEQFDDAAAALVQAEVEVGDNHDLRHKIATRLIECLRRLGRYGEVGRELSRQVETGAEQTGKGPVLATMSGQKITEADLDRMIERQVDRMLALQNASHDFAAREAVLRQLSTPRARSQMLNELLQTELACRRARELKLDREDEFLDARDHLEQSLLASRFMQRELDKIEPTEVDVASYYNANQQRYEEPETARVHLIELKDEEDPAELLGRIDSADDFTKLVAQRQPPEEATGEAPESRQLTRGQFDPVLGDVEGLFATSAGEWTREPHVNNDKKYLVLVKSKTPARIPPLPEVGDRVEADYLAVKQQELSQKLFRDLMARYNVKIMPPDDSPQLEDGEDQQEATESNGTESDQEAQS